MADTVSKLYAEIGFKVNQDGLKQAQRVLADMANQMSAINNATKEAAKQYGIFSREQSQQSLKDAKIATENERAEVQRNKRKLDNKKFEHKQLMDLAKLEFQVEKYNASEKQKIERQQTKEAEKASKAQKKRLSDMLHSFRSFAVGLRNTFLTLSGIGAGGVIYGMKQSLDRSIPTRDFLMTTGVSLSQLQGVMSRMVNVGSRMSQQQIMGDIQKVSQNLSDIALGQGELSPYKLLHVAAQRGDVMGVIRGVEQSVKGLDNAMALNLTRRVGLSDDWLASWRFKERYGGDQRQINDEQLKSIVEADIALRQLKFAFKNLADHITAAVSPVITKMAHSIRDWLQSISAWIDEHPDTINGLLDSLHELYKAIRIGAFLIGEAIEWLKGVLSFSSSDSKILNREPTFKEYLQGYRKGDASKINTTTEKDMLNFLGRDNIKEFNNDRRIISRNIINASDNSVQNVTINANTEDELIEKVANTVEEKQKSNRETWLDNLYSNSDLYVVSPVIGSASARS